MAEKIDVRPRNLRSLIDEIEVGLLKIPQFQREVVWDLPDCVKLIDSVYKCFPIGSLVIWETYEKLADVRSIGNITLPLPPDGRKPSYVLDGQQRLTALYACAKEASVKRKNRRNPIPYVAWYDFEKDEFTHLKPEIGVTFRQLISDNYDPFRDPLPEIYKPIFTKVRTVLLEKYKFACVEIDERDLEQACIIFERINNSGKKLTVFDLLVAKLYPFSFDLRAKWKELEKSLKHFDGLNPILPMQSISLKTIRLDEDKTSSEFEKYGCHKRHLLKIDSTYVSENWEEVTECFKLALDFAQTRLGIAEYDLLAYEPTIPLITLFFLLNDHKGPNGNQAIWLERYFWRSCISARYSSSPESSMEEDGLLIREIQRNGSPALLKVNQVTPEMILDARYDRRDGFVLTILAMLASRKPRSFKSSTLIPIPTSFSKYNATELHHIFPRGWLKRTGKKDWLDKEHSLANICMAPAKEQRHEIAAKPPSEYLEMFSTSNPQLDLALESHLLNGELEKYLKKDQFDDFLKARAKVMADKLNSLAGLD
ncbi:MAG TPA: DUF262 domain-containing protein [bacterium]|nr:DUF262 domain-containing protein [bacterium]